MQQAFAECLLNEPKPFLQSLRNYRHLQILLKVEGKLLTF